MRFANLTLAADSVPNERIWELVDGTGVPSNYDVKFTLEKKELDNMPDAGVAAVELHDHELRIEGSLPNAWHVAKVIENDGLVGEGRAKVRFEHLKRIIAPTFRGRYEPILMTITKKGKVV